MVRKGVRLLSAYTGFRPLTGIVPTEWEPVDTATWFSPPYGDGTAECSVKFTGNQVFAPLRGWYKNQTNSVCKILVFAPLRGWYTKYITEYRKMEELNA